MRNEKTNNIVMTAMFVSLVMAATYMGVPTPGSMGGYVHFGTLVMLAIAIKYGKYYGALAGGIGMTLFDLFSPWIAWAPGTFVVRITMGFVVGLIASIKVEDNQEGNFLMKNKTLIRNIVAILAGAAIMIPGYFVYQAWMLSAANDGGYDLAIISIPGNITQFLIGFVSLYLVRFLPDKESIGIK